MTSAPAGTARAMFPAMVELPSSPDLPPQLVGSRCPECGAIFAAQRVVCLQCARRGCERWLLSPTGEVYTFTIVRQQPPGSVMKIPYAIAQVRLDDGPIVSGPLVDLEVDDVFVGLPVEITMCAAGEDKEGATLMAHAFRPRKEAKT